MPLSNSSQHVCVTPVFPFVKPRKLGDGSLHIVDTESHLYLFSFSAFFPRAWFLSTNFKRIDIPMLVSPGQNHLIFFPRFGSLLF